MCTTKLTPEKGKSDNFVAYSLLGAWFSRGSEKMLSEDYLVPSRLIPHRMHSVCCTHSDSNERRRCKHYFDGFTYPYHRANFYFHSHVRTATRRPTRTPTATHTPWPTLTPTPTFAPLKVKLPHDLYFLSPGSIKADNGAQPKQIWRLATNGATLTEITHEDYDVEEFDVSPVTGRVAYVTDQLHRNQLIFIRPDGTGRKVIVDDGPDDGGRSNWVDSLRWSPDGQILAYHHDGIILYQVQTGQTVKVFADHPDEYQRYSPELWSPDGKHLLVKQGGYEGGWWMLYNLKEKILTELNGPNAHGTASWSADSRLAVFSSSYLMGDDCVDLLQFDVFAQMGQH